MWFKSKSPLGDFEQLVLFGVLRLGEEAYGAAIRQEIHARSGRDVSINAVYTTLDRLEGKGLVRRQRCPKDRRQHLCWITAEGLALLEKIDTLAPRAQEDSLKGLRQKDRVTFIRLLDAIRAAHQ